MADSQAMQTYNDGRRLDSWLSEMYRADQLGVGNRILVFRRAQSTVSADPQLLTIARERIPILEQTCRARPNAHVESKQLEYLRHLITEPAHG